MPTAPFIDTDTDTALKITEYRAALVVEEFNASPACTSIKLQLLHEVHDEAALNKAYAVAQKLRCLKGDV